MITKVKKALENASIINDSCVAVAFSGGCDSSALLHVTKLLSEELGFKLCAIHVNHCLRGDESDADAAFAQKTCEAYGVKLHTYCIDVASESEKSGESTELCARRLRYEIFDRFVADGWTVATAHTASDNAETVLFNMARGTGIKGLCGIPRKRTGYVRPLIDVTRSDIEAYCTENAVEFVTDSTNLTDDYTRNFIRHNIVPNFKQINPSFEAAVLEMSDQLRAVDVFLDRLADSALDQCKSELGYNCAQLLQLDEAVLTRAIRLAVSRHTGRTLDSKKTYDVLKIVRQGGKILLFDNWYVACNKYFRIYRAKEKTSNIVAVKEGLVTFGTYQFEFSTKSYSVNNLLMQNAVDCDKILNCMEIRTRKSGETVKLKGRPNKQIRRIMNEIKVPDAQRDAYPIVADELGAIFVPGAGVAERVVPDSNTKKVIIITFKGDNNA